ncbi:hypothetical protein [Nakamurella lactea]|uniref:hypothetical protein n=1 Tax=Nakamurella lactea TaxID=459515 RepID=UPI00048E8ADC|nr:hypothetical protein [Nakamurella lactea]
MTYALRGTDPAAQPDGPAGSRWNSLLVLVGAGWVVLGGLVAAVTGPLDLEHGSWTAAYLVLVCGMAQSAFGEVRAHLTLPSVRWARWGQLIGWNLGNIAVIAGILIGVPVLSDLGGVLLLMALVVEFRSAGGSGRPLLAGLYRAVLATLIVSIPIGLVLGHIGAG